MPDSLRIDSLPYYMSDQSVRAIFPTLSDQFFEPGQGVNVHIETQVCDYVNEPSGYLEHRPTGRILIVVEGPREVLGDVIAAVGAVTQEGRHHA